MKGQSKSNEEEGEMREDRGGRKLIRERGRIRGEMERKGSK